jgi:NAD(P)H-nitrite reductase large subunit
MREILERAGVTIITDNTVSRITNYKPGEVSGVVMADGMTLHCDMVIFAIGVRPRLDIVNGTDIKTNRGILVDEKMASSVGDVYACGDVAEAYDFVYGENRLTPIWPNAYIGGMVAGLNMAGESAVYPGGTAMNSMKYFGVSIVSAGMSAEPDESCEVLINRENGNYRKVVLKDGVLVGMSFSGDIETSGIIYNLMKDRIDVSDFKEALISADFGLSSMPEELWKPKLSMPGALMDSSMTAVEEEEIEVIDE